MRRKGNDKFLSSVQPLTNSNIKRRGLLTHHKQYGTVAKLINITRGTILTLGAFFLQGLSVQGKRLIAENKAIKVSN